MRIRYGDKAVVDNGKLMGYCLCASHPRGMFKARQFKIRLGFGSDDVGLLKLALLNAVGTSDKARADERDEFGQRYTLEFLMQGPAGKAIVRSHWILRNGENCPRFLSCSVLS